MTEDTENTMLTPDEAAIYTRFARGTLAVYRTKNIGPRYHKVMDKVYYKKADLDEWMQRNPVETN